MSGGQAIPQVIPWMAAEGERPPEVWTKDGAEVSKIPVEDGAVHNFPAESVTPHPVAEHTTRVGQPINLQDPVAESATKGGQPPDVEEGAGESWEESGEDEFLQATQPEWQILQRSEWSAEERARRIYRNRTVAMLRRYFRYSIETGRLPSLLGREFFRSNVTSYRVSTFEDRVIFVFDMEKALDRLDDFSRQIIARHILQEHDQEATSRLLHVGERTVRRYVPITLDLLSEVLLDMGLIDRVNSDGKKSCQGGQEDENSVSSWEHGKNNHDYSLDTKGA